MVQCHKWIFFSTAQLEEVLDPYLADTNIGLPYWDWTKDSSVPDVWENIQSPIKAHRSKDYNWQVWRGWKGAQEQEGGQMSEGVDQRGGVSRGGRRV